MKKLIVISILLLSNLCYAATSTTTLESYVGNSAKANESQSDKLHLIGLQNGAFVQKAYSSIHVSGSADVAASISSASSATPGDTDNFGFVSGVLKKVTWSNIRLTLKTFFDNIYHGLTVTWSEITGKPSTLSGYGITDAESKTAFNSYSANRQSQFNTKLDKTKFSSYSANRQIQANNKVDVVRFTTYSANHSAVTGTGGGTVTSVSVSAPLTGGPITSSGTIGIGQATTSTNGYLSSTDWNTFNGKLATNGNGSALTRITANQTINSYNPTDPQWGGVCNGDVSNKTVDTLALYNIAQTIKTAGTGYFFIPPGKNCILGQKSDAVIPTAPMAIVGVPSVLSAPIAPIANTPVSGGNITPGTHSYKIVYITTFGDLTTTTGAASNQINAVTGTGQTVTVSNIPIGPQNIVTARQIYRTKTGDSGNYYLLATIKDNINTTYVDTIDDSQLTIVAPAVNNTTVPSINHVGLYGGGQITLDDNYGFFCTYCNDVKVQDVTFDYLNDWTPEPVSSPYGQFGMTTGRNIGFPVSVQWSTNVLYDNIVTKRVSAFGLFTYMVNYLDVRNNRVLGSKRDGIHIDCSDNWTVTNNYVSDTQDDAYGLIAGNKYVMTTPPVGSETGIYTLNRYLEPGYLSGVTMNGQVMNTYNARVINNVAKNVNYVAGIGLRGLNKVIATGNIIDNIAGSGILLEQWRNTNVANLFPTTESIIADNILTNVARSNGASSDSDNIHGITIGNLSKKVIVSNNYINGSGFTGGYATNPTNGKATGSGAIYAFANVSGIQIKNNHAYNVINNYGSTYPLSNAGVSVLDNNENGLNVTPVIAGSSLGMIKNGGTGYTILSDGTMNISSGGSAGTTTNSINFNNSGTGDSSGTSFNGSTSKTISYNTIGAQANLGYTAENIANKNANNGYPGLNSSGHLGIGTTSPLAPLHIVESTNESPLFIDYSNDSGGPSITQRASNGSPGAETGRKFGQTLMVYGARPWIATGGPGVGAYTTSGVGTISLIVQEPDVAGASGLTTTAKGTALTFQTTQVGTSTNAERLRIQNTGDISIGSTVDNGYKLEVTGTAKVTADLTVGGHTTFESVTSTGATGTGKLVYDNSPTLVTPNIGAATGTSLNVSGNLTSSGNASITGTVAGSQLISSVATGTPPLIVSSTTVVPNLHAATADSLSGLGNVAGINGTFSGQVTMTGTAPTGKFGSSTATILGGSTDNKGNMSWTGTSGGTATVTFSATWPNNPVCVCNAYTSGSPILCAVTATTTTTATINIPASTVNPAVTWLCL